VIRRRCILSYLPTPGIALAACTMLALQVAPVRAVDFSEFSRARDELRAQQRSAARERGPRSPAARALHARPSIPRAAAAASRSARASVAANAPLPEGPLLLVVSLDKQRMSVFSKGQIVETTMVSTGTARDPTPTGVFSVIEKAEKHFSNLYNGAPMPFMQRLTMSGVALHSGHVTGRVESHGCVRLPHEYARRLFRMTQLGVRVIVSQDDPVAVEMADMRLLSPERIAAATRVAVVASSEIVTGTISDSGASPPAPAAVDRSIDPRTGKPKGPMALKRDEVLREAPVSILVSRAEGRVYVRHMFESLIEAPIAIAEPRRPIGTHVYTLTSRAEDGGDQRWSAISVKLMPRRIAAIRVLAGRGSRAARAAQVRATPAVAEEGTASSAAEAVERFALPSEVVAQIAPLLRPGTTLIVTDLPQSQRVRPGWTDVIVTP
jgi:lipoprotein-anchoring transpeptidase ErfK/SrfK